MKHRTIDYDVQEVEPGLLRWNIYPGNGKVQGPAEFRTRERAVDACLAKIDNGSGAALETIAAAVNLEDTDCSPSLSLRGGLLWASYLERELYFHHRAIVITHLDFQLAHETVMRIKPARLVSNEIGKRVCRFILHGL